MIRFLLLLISTASLLLGQVENQIPRIEDPHAILGEFFPKYSLNNFTMNKLSGGYSDACNYRIDTTEKGELMSYALRYYSKKRLQTNISSEFYMFKEASKMEIAPYIYEVSKDERAILTEFIKNKKLTLKQIKEPKTIKRIAKAILKIHSIPKNPFPTSGVLDKYEQIYQSLSPTTNHKKAIAIIRNGVNALHHKDGMKKSIHGELHPRNIFITEKKIQFIDWVETTWDVPFYDLSYFALLNDFGDKEEELLLLYYLGHHPNETEMEQYNLTKMINLAGAYLTLERINKETYGNTLTTAREAEGKSWSYYVQIFASDNSELDPQFFKDLAIKALEEASLLER